MENWEKMEKVNHPSHYNKPGRKECLVEMEEKYGAEVTAVFCLTNAYKYIYRAGDKEDNPASQDINKAKFYLAYTEGLIAKYGFLFINEQQIEKTELYLDVKRLLEDF